jgi:hypothetical protein
VETDSSVAVHIAIKRSRTIAPPEPWQKHSQVAAVDNSIPRKVGGEYVDLKAKCAAGRSVTGRKHLVRRCENSCSVLPITVHASIDCIDDGVAKV